MGRVRLRALEKRRATIRAAEVIRDAVLIAASNPHAVDLERIARIQVAHDDADGAAREVGARLGAEGGGPRAFEGVGWQVPDLLGQMPAAADFYFDSVSQVRLDRWSSGRVALIGDAGYAAGPGGNGTGTAVVAAYVLAGELAAASGDYGAAFARYEHLLRGYVARGQKQALGGRTEAEPPPWSEVSST